MSLKSVPAHPLQTETVDECYTNFALTGYLLLDAVLSQLS
ncbi:uncharacterized protein FTOL_11421 [Fusarium torulosum]|uniref:Uncharacterized protein n=1 Tax=Fusarium torulosum TaxID=33205 RepID=A0AAE8MKC3_9HYPO|nr:uncharacterized protein FTOL_11421 [Fusarium torulosum]